MKKERRFDRYIVFTFLISAILRVIPYLQNFTFRFRLDDFGPLVYPAYLAGYDWSSYVQGNEHYYGFGYYWIMAPLFRLISSPRVLMVAIAAVNSLVILLIAVLIYHLLVTYLGIQRGWTAVFFSIVPTMFYGTIRERGTFWLHTDNEIALLLAVWLTVWAILGAARASGRSLRVRCIHAAAVSAALTWALSVHERAMALVLAAAFAELLLFLMKRRWLMQPVVFYGSLAAGYLLQRTMRRMVIGVLWRGGWPSVNTNAFNDVGLWFLKSGTAVKAFLTILFGNLHSIVVKGFGVTAIAIVLLLVWLVRNLFRQKRMREQGEDTNALPDGDILILLIFGVCIAVTLAGLCVRWGLKLLPGMTDYTVSKGYKGICYGRYYESYVSPVILAVFVNLFRRKSTPADRTMAEGWWGLFFGAEILFFAFIYYKLLKVKELTGASYYNMSYSLYLFHGQTKGFYAGITIAVPVIVMTLLTAAVLYESRPVFNGQRVIVTGRHLTVAAAVLILLLFGIDRLDQIETFDPTVTFYDTENMTKTLTDLEEQDLLPEHLYLPQNNWCFGLQFMKKELQFTTGEPGEEQLEEDNLIITTPQQPQYQEEGYEEFLVGDHWIYTNREETSRRLEEFLNRE